MSIRTAVACAVSINALACLLSVAHAQATVPFKATATLNEMLDPTTNSCASEMPSGGSSAMGSSSGSGVGSVIGKFDLMAQDCVTSVSPYFIPPFYFKSRQFMLTTVSGEQLWGSYEGTAIPSGSATLSLSGSFKITGGSGRFAYAVGSGTLEVVEDISNPVLAKGFVTFVGRISAPR